MADQPSPPTARAPQPFVRLAGVDMRFAGHHAVRDLDLDIAAGEFVAIMGPSGCGKSTTLRMIAGLEQPTAGRIEIGGQDMADVPAHARNTPMVWQSLALFPFLSVIDNVAFALRMKGVSPAERRRRSMEWLERLDLASMADRDVGQLSGGQRQRVAIARALVTQPPLLLLDEPFSALDAHLRVRLQTELTRLHRELKITFVYVTHAQSEAFAMADRVVVMNEGRVQQTGPPEAIYRTPANPFVARFIGMNNLLEGRAGATRDGMVEIATPHGIFRAPATRDVAAGEPAALVIAADRTLLVEDGCGVAGEVIGVEFVGSTKTVFVELADGSEFRVQKPHHEVEALRLVPGQRIALGWDPGHVWLLPRPD